MIVLTLSICATLFLTNVFTNKNSILTHIGKNSYPIYILHLYFVTLLNSYLFKQLIPTNEYYFLCFTVITTIILVFILSRDFVVKIFNKVLNIVNKMILKT